MNTTECKNVNRNTIKCNIIRHYNVMKTTECKNLKYQKKYHVRTTDRTPTSDTFKVPNTWFARSLMADGNIPTRIPVTGGQIQVLWTNCDFLPKSRYISETVQDRAVLTDGWIDRIATIRYDTIYHIYICICIIYLTCSEKLTVSQLSAPVTIIVPIL